MLSALNLVRTIRWQRLAVAVALTYLVADTYPHPQLAPGALVQGLAQLNHSLGEGVEDNRRSPRD